MQVWWEFHCDFGHAWKVLGRDVEPRVPVCPEGHEAVTVHRAAPADRVRICIVPAARIDDSATGRVSLERRYLLEIQPWDQSDVLRSDDDYVWDEVLKLAQWFQNLTWVDAQRRWADSRLRPSIADRPVAERLNRSAWIDDDLAGAIEDLFADPEPAYAVAGAHGAALPAGWREPPEDETRPVLDRLRGLDEVLRAHLRLLADQVPEFSDSESLVRLRAEGLSILISLRELHLRVPELNEPKDRPRTN
jgi:hypothetical protein